MANEVVNTSINKKTDITKNYLELSKQHRVTSPLLTEFDFETGYKVYMSNAATRTFNDMCFDMQCVGDGFSRERRKRGRV